MSCSYQKILVPIDGSDSSYKAILEAIKIAKLSGGRIDLLHVVTLSEHVQIYSHFHEAYLPDHYVDEITNLGDEIIKTAMEEIPRELQGIGKIESGDPRSILQQYVTTEPYDLVVIGCRGLGALPGLFMGSVSQFLVQNATCPVMVVK